jgi:hypothetical protein
MAAWKQRVEVRTRYGSQKHAPGYLLPPTREKFLAYISYPNHNIPTTKVQKLERRNENFTSKLILRSRAWNVN